MCKKLLILSIFILGSFTSSGIARAESGQVEDEIEQNMNENRARSRRIAGTILNTFGGVGLLGATITGVPAIIDLAKWGPNTGSAILGFTALVNLVWSVPVLAVGITLYRKGTRSSRHANLPLPIASYDPTNFTYALGLRGLF